MQIEWEVEDGYVGKSRPQHSEVDDDELKECETVDEAIKLIEDAVQEDFENNISWCLRSYETIIAEIEELITR